MTKKRRCLIAAALVMLAVLTTIAVVAFVAWPTLPNAPGVTRENFARIENGMSLDEVQTIFGKSCNGVFWRIHGTTASWSAEEPLVDITVSIYLDDGGVSGKRWNGEPESLIEKIRGWLCLP